MPSQDLPDKSHFHVGFLEYIVEKKTTNCREDIITFEYHINFDNQI